MKLTANSLVFRKPDNLHNHFRDDFRLEKLLIHTVQQFSRAIAMPNLDPPVKTGREAMAYKAKIETLATALGYPKFQALPTIYITPATTPADIEEAKAAGVVAAKVYPKHGTTQSSHGIQDYDAASFHLVLEALQRHNLLSLWHCEIADQTIAPRDREARFIPIISQIVDKHPGLKVVFEHISSKEGVHFVASAKDNVAATITAHHLFLTEQDLHNPHHCCMPVPKTVEDRQAVMEAALSGNTKFFYGGDDAPHHRKTKEGVEKPTFGVWCGPTTLPLLIDFFETHNKLDLLEPFTSEFGAKFYGLPLNEETITFQRSPWDVLENYADVVPFQATKSMKWKLLLPV